MGKLRDGLLARTSQLKALVNELFEDIQLYGIDLKVNVICREFKGGKDGKFNFYIEDYDYIDKPVLKLTKDEIASHIYATSLLGLLVLDIEDLKYDQALLNVITFFYEIETLQELANKLDVSRQYVDKNIKLTGCFEPGFKKKLIQHFGLRDDFFEVPKLNGIEMFIQQKRRKYNYKNNNKA